MDSIIFGLGLFVGGMLSCVLVLNVGVASAIQTFAFIGVGVIVVLIAKLAHSWSRSRLGDRRLQKMAENA